MSVLSQIKSKRKKRKISQKKMAELLNISQPGYQKIEQGTNVLSIDRFIQICSILEIKSYNELLPTVNAEIVEEIEKVLMAGSLAFDNIRNNTNHIRNLLTDIIDKVETESIDKNTQIEELRFLDNYLAIIRKESYINGYKYISIQDLLERID